MPGTLLTIGESLLARYEIIGFLGEGGMQEVYLAQDRTFGRKVAVKVPKNESASKRFTRSARLSAKVTHPNVAKTLDYLTDERCDYLVEEFIDGRNLQERLDNEFLRLDPHLAAHIIHLIAKGVAASHHVGVMHRDLKPSNIMVSNDANLSTVKVTDFGIAKMAEEEIDQAVSVGTEESITGSHTVMGALPYMAPEIFEAAFGSVSYPSDVWAVGALLYHLLVGERPFGSGIRAISKIIKTDLPPRETVLKVRFQFASVADDLWAVVMACCRRDQSQRPTIDQLVSMLSLICYSVSERVTGAITDYGTPWKECGYLRTDGGESCFFHLDSFYGEKPVVGMRVNFAPFIGRPHKRAFPVLPLRPH